MINLYEKLGILPDADANQVQRALTRAAQSQSLTIEMLQKMRDTLLNEHNRALYDQKLFEAFPQLREQMEKAHEEEEKIRAQRLQSEAKQSSKLRAKPQGLISGLKKIASDFDEKINHNGFLNNSLVQGMLGNMSSLSDKELQSYHRYLFEDETLTTGYKLVRDMILFTDYRIIFIDKQGATGKKQSFKSIYLMNIVDVEMETAGMGLDDSEITLTYLSGVYRKSYNESMKKVKFEFPKSADIVPLYTMLGSIALQNRMSINQE